MTKTKKSKPKKTKKAPKKPASKKVAKKMAVAPKLKAKSDKTVQLPKTAKETTKETAKETIKLTVKLSKKIPMPNAEPLTAKGSSKIAAVAKEVEELEALLKEDESNDVELRDAEGRLYCRVRDCDELSVVDLYCRFHYLRLWKKIQLRKKILVDGKLDKYIEDLTQRYPDKFVEMIRNDLRTEKDFLAAINELDIDESALDAEMDEDQGLLDEVRGLQTGGGTGSEDQGDEF